MDRPGYYAAPSPTSDLSRHGALVPRVGVGDVTATVQGLTLHIAGATRLGLDLPADRWRDIHVRSAARIVDRILAIDDRPLDEKRPPARRMIGNCHHASLLAVALLRHAGVPARCRVGFAAYLELGMQTDHWVVEVLDEDAWRRLDPDRNGGSADGFTDACTAWRACRAGEADPQLHGINDVRGWSFIRSNVVRDLAAMCKVELLPWDFWGLMLRPSAERLPELIDELALLDDDARFDERTDRFVADPLLNPGRSTVSEYITGEEIVIDLPDAW